MDILRFTTAGNVDDGKSTLVGRLFYEYGKIPKDLWESIERSSQRRGNDSANLAFFTDGLTEEREKGITIDAAFRYFSTENRKFILADSPGHLEYLPNMVTAATQAEAAVVLVDAARGVSPQTKRHAWILKWLGIQNLFFAVNKIDAIGFDESKFKAIESELKTWIAQSGFKVDVTIAPVSALLGDNLIRKSDRLSWYSGPTLDRWLHSVTPPRARDSSPVRFPIQISRQIEHTTEFLGTLRSGVLKRGTSLYSPRTKKSYSVERIFWGTKEISEAPAGLPLRVVLNGDAQTLSRGDLLCEEGEKPQGSEKWSFEFCAFSELDSNRDRFFAQTSVGESEVSSFSVDEHFDPEKLKWSPISSSSIQPASIGRGVLTFDRPVFEDSYGTFPGSGRMILIRKSDHRTAVAVLLKKPL